VSADDPLTWTARICRSRNSVIRGNRKYENNWLGNEQMHLWLPARLRHRYVVTFDLFDFLIVYFKSFAHGNLWGQHCHQFCSLVSPAFGAWSLWSFLTLTFVLVRHVTRLCWLGAAKKIFLGAIVIGKCTQLTIAITGGATILNKLLRAERAESFSVCTPLVTFWGYISHKWKNNCQINLFWGKKVIWGKFPPVSSPSYMSGPSHLKTTQ